MNNRRMKNRIFAIAIALTMAAGFGSPVMAGSNDKSIPAESTFEGKTVTTVMAVRKDDTIKNNLKGENSREENKRIYNLDFSWFKPVIPGDFNPYDTMKPDFSWYVPSKPEDVNPYDVRK